MTVGMLRQAIAWLIWDTFRQARASGIAWILGIVSTVAILVCLSIGVEGGDRLVQPGEDVTHFIPRVDRTEAHKKGVGQEVLEVKGRVTFAFGLFEAPIVRDREDAVHFLRVVLAGFVADTSGLLLTLLWTAGFLPAFLHPNAVTVLLAKPTPRWVLLAGKYLGVLAFVFAAASFFVVGTWLAMGLRTGIWETRYLWAVVLLTLNFSAFFTFSVLLAVVTRNSVACVFGAVLFWLLCWGMNYGRHTAHDMTAAAVASPFSHTMLAAADVGYWMLPKPYDMQFVLFQTIGGHPAFAALYESPALRSIPFGLVLATSAIFPLVLFLLAAQQLADMEF